MNFALLMLICGVTGVIGEYFCKLASQSVGDLRTAYTFVPAILWGGSAWIWVQMYSQKTMSQVIAIYSPTLLLATATMAIVLFGEPLTWKLVLAYVLVGVVIYLVG